MELTDKAYFEIVDLFARGSSASDIVAFHPSPETQDRVRYLLEQMMQLVKARARSFSTKNS
jgi:hypothetical protein